MRMRNLKHQKVEWRMSDCRNLRAQLRQTMETPMPILEYTPVRTGQQITKQEKRAVPIRHSVGHHESEKQRDRKLQDIMPIAFGLRFSPASLLRKHLHEKVVIEKRKLDLLDQDRNKRIHGDLK
jgi:hypothetical protein